MDNTKTQNRTHRILYIYIAVGIFVDILHEKYRHVGNVYNKINFIKMIVKVILSFLSFIVYVRNSFIHNISVQQVSKIIVHNREFCHYQKSSLKTLQVNVLTRMNRLNQPFYNVITITINIPIKYLMTSEEIPLIYTLNIIMLMAPR